MKVLKGLLGIVGVAVLTSCGNYTEEFTIKEDGSGKYELYTDIVSGGIAMTTEMASMFSPEPLNEQQKDSLRMYAEEKIWEDFPGEVDSVIDIASEMPDSLLNYGENRKHAENMNGFMRGSREKGYVHGGFAYNFDSGSSFSDFMQFIEDVQDKNGTAKDGAAGMLGKFSKVDSKTSYELEKKKFTRTTKYTPKEEGGDDFEMDKMLAMFGDGKYQTIINTERKIKKVKSSHIVSQEDYKVVLEYDFQAALAGEENTDFEIIFE